MTSATIEDYLKAIYMLNHGDEGEAPATTSALAAQLGLTAATVTNMVQKLARPEFDLLQYTPYQGVRLTPQGERIALGVIRRHRLLELYLAERLGLGWDQVHAEAERLEHYISPTLEERIAAALGDPQVDPHGHPIPTITGEVPPQASTRLARLAPGQEAIVLSVGDRDPELLRYLAERQLTPGVCLTVVAWEPFGGPLHVRIGPAGEGGEVTVGLAAAEQVRVGLSPTILPAPAAANAETPARP